MLGREITPFTEQQSKQLLKVSQGHALEAFVTVALSCGLRVGEALGLRWTDVDLKLGTLMVRQALQRTGGDPVARRALRRGAHPAALGNQAGPAGGQDASGPASA